jgi:hypothetical protein
MSGRKGKPSGEVYFARLYTHEGLDMNTVKIGCSHSLELRERQLSSGMPFTCRVIGSFPGTMMDEHFMHLWFRRFHIRGEYFKANPLLTDVINRGVRLGKNPLISIGSDEGFRWSELNCQRFLSENAITAADLEKYGDYRSGYAIIKRLEKDPRGNRKIAATLMVVALRRGLTFRWPDDFWDVPENQAA